MSDQQAAFLPHLIPLLKVANAVAELDDYKGDDPESAHYFADHVLLDLLPEAVRDAWARLSDRCDGFWYA